ncbi:MAG: stalk domain-containing protein [Peptostreptococcaceae bacterium]|nr:stalk domain-containing protein [Peptostreptococcaceae bacterium]
MERKVQKSKMGQRLLSLILSIGGGGTLNAHADSETPFTHIYVDKKLYELADESTPLPAGLTWEKSTSTLVMNGFNGESIQGDNAFGNLLNVRVEGENTLRRVEREGDKGIVVDGNLNIRGNGTLSLYDLDIRAKKTSIEDTQILCNIYANLRFSELSINNATIRAYLEGEPNRSGSWQQIIYASKISIEGNSVLELDSKTDIISVGIYAYGGITVDTIGMIRINMNTNRASLDYVYGISGGEVDRTNKGVILKNGTIDIQVQSPKTKTRAFQYEPKLEGQMRLESGKWFEKSVRYTSAPPPVTIERIEVAPPSTTTYYEGDTLNLDDMQVTIHKSDGNNEVVSPADFASKGITIKPSATDKLKVSDKKIVVTHTASGKTAETPITVKALHTITIVNDGGAEVQTLVEGKVGNKAKLGQTITVNVNNIPEDKILSEIKVVGGMLDRTINNGETFAMPEADVTITVTLAEKPKHTVTVNNDGNGEATANPTEQYEGKEVVLNAVPNPGFHFKEWNVTAGGVTVQNNKFTMGNQAVTIEAIFEQNEASAYAIVVENDGHGTGTANVNSAAKDTEITLTSHPNTGYRFKEWQVIEGDVEISSEGKFLMPDKAVKVRAVFEEIPFTITFKANGGTGADKTETVAPNAPFTLPANPFTPPANKVFDKWMIGNQTFDAGAQYTFTQDTEVFASWKDKPSSGGSSGGGPSGGGITGGGGGGGTPSTPAKDKKPVTEQKSVVTEFGKDVVAKLRIANKEYKVVEDGKVVSKMMDATPVIHQGRTMLPARMIAELLGIEVKFDTATKTAKFTFVKEVDGKSKENIVELTLGQKMMKVNGKSQMLSADLLNTNGRILLPMTDIQKALKELGLAIDVKWDHETKEITLLDMK